MRSSDWSSDVCSSDLRRFALHRCTRCRMGKTQVLGMQGLAAESTQRGGELGTGRLGDTQRTAIQRIADQWVPDMRHVNADLMGTPGFQATFQCGICAIALVYADMGDRGRAAFNTRLHKPTPDYANPSRRERVVPVM